VGDLALAPDGAVWVSSGTTVAVYRDGSWTRAWSAPSGTALRGLVAAPDGTVWVGQDRELVGLRQEGDRYVSRSLQCPWIFSRLAVTTDGTIYAGSFSYSDGPGGLARSDGVTCEFVDAVGDGKVHEVSELSAGPAGSLLAIVFDGLGAVCPCRAWTVIVRDGRWSTISGPTVDAGVDVGQIMDRGGHPWRIAGGALQRYAAGIWRTVAPSALALAMAPDGVLWYETDRGLERIQTDEVGG
ncbi:MAG TPA: hypothetical protein VEY67_09330, partial [Candidatus Dormibacteraeota bacterium]|nr:hypothetical protein [Candidatus Dormibacteraeota bacterium]